MQIKEHLLQIETKIQQLEHQLDFLRKIDDLQTGIIELSIAISKEIQFEIEKAIQEINFISIMSNLELCYLTKNILLAKSKTEKQYLIKLVHLNVYEFSITYNKKVKLIKTLIPSPDEYSKAFKHINKQIDKIKERHSFQFKTSFIRNKMAAHTELALSDYFENRALLNEDQCLDLVSDFQKFHNNLFLFIALLQECHNVGLPRNLNVEDIFQTLTH